MIHTSESKGDVNDLLSFVVPKIMVSICWLGNKLNLQGYKEWSFNGTIKSLNKVSLFFVMGNYLSSSFSVW
jgi:hypothetical protein